MHKKKPTRQQKVFLASCGLKPENWYIERETSDYYYAVSKNGQHRLLQKEKKKNCK